MKKIKISGILALVLVAAICITSGFTEKHKFPEIKSKEWKTTDLKAGDIVFQVSLSGQGKAIQLATKSKYTHCAIILDDGKGPYVFEAVQPVKRTAVEEWIEQGDDQHYVVKRLKNADKVLTPAVLKKMNSASKQFIGKDYDITFEWSDKKIYCSELVWKMYQRCTGIEISTPQKLRDFDLTSNIVKEKMRERYGSNIPLDETVISPAALFDSNLLTAVVSR